MVMMGQRTEVTVSRIEDGWRPGAERRSGGWATATETLAPAARTHGESEYRSYTLLHGSAKATKIESSYLNEIPLQMSPKGMWGPENMKIKNFRWGLFEFYIFLY